MTACSLYRMRDARRRLLYVGITTRGGQRISQHRRSQPWWPDVAQPAVSAWENGHKLPSPGHVAALNDLLGEAVAA